MSRCLFRCSYEVAELGRHLREAEEFEFSFERPRPCVVHLSKSYWERQPSDTGSAICAAETTEEEADDTAEFVNGVLDELSSAMIPAVAVFRWRCGLAEGPRRPASPVLSGAAALSYDGGAAIRRRHPTARKRCRQPQPFP